MFQKTDHEDVRASLELIYNISLVLNSPLDLSTVLKRVIILSMKSVGAISGSLIVLDDHGDPVDSAIVAGERVHEGTTRQLQATLETGLAGWVVRNREAALVPNTCLDDRWLQRTDDASDRIDRKSAVSAPIFAHGKIVGVMTLVHPIPGFFNEDHLALIQIITGQAGIAVLNARLYAESQRKARILTVLAESTMAVTASLNMDEVLQGILEQACQALQVEGVSLALIDPTTGELVLYAAAAEDSKNLIGVRAGPGQGIAGWVAREGRGIVVPDVRTDPHYDPRVDCLLGFQARAIACSPIRSRGEVVGVLEAINPPKMEFSQDALLVLAGIGSLAGTSIQHAQLFERLEAAHKRYRELYDDREDLLSMIYHDLRSPLSNVISSLEQLEAMVPKNDLSLRPLIEIAARSTMRIQDLTCSLLDIRRMEVGQPVGQYQRYSVPDLIAESVEAVNPSAEDRKQEIRVILAPDLPHLTLDPEMIRRVLINLLENAIKYSPQGSKIILSARRERVWALIGVKDQGPGIPPADQENIFDKFTRLQSKDGAAVQSGGLGLGLAYCRLAVEEHGGRIWVESMPGTGAHFKFVLPVQNHSNDESRQESSEYEG